MASRQGRQVFISERSHILLSVVAVSKGISIQALADHAVRLLLTSEITNDLPASTKRMIIDMVAKEGTTSRPTRMSVERLREIVDELEAGIKQEPALEVAAK